MAKTRRKRWLLQIKMEEEQIKKLKKIGLFAGVIIILMILAILISFLLFTTKKPDETSYYFKPEPNTWIEDNTIINITEGKIINVKKATKAQGYYDGKKEELYFNENVVPFFPGGYYKGIPFEKSYIDPTLFINMTELYIPGNTEEELIKKYAKISIGNEMDPYDGIINGFILGKIENETVVYYIFVDEDWKNNMTFTNILWSSNLKNADATSIRQFDFSNGQDGIYYDKIDNFGNWFFGKRKGGIFVGEITLDTLKITDPNELNVTIIYIQ
ncbi:MAG: hypothetical protein V1859_06070 [archaeon]